MPSNQFNGNSNNLLAQIPIPFNQPFGLQIGIPPFGHFTGGFGQHNLNPMAVTQFNMSQLSQPFPINSAPFFNNQNIHLLNGQFGMSAPMQSMNQFVQMQMPNFPMQVSQGLGHQQLQANALVQAQQQSQNVWPPVFANQQASCLSSALLFLFV